MKLRIQLHIFLLLFAYSGNVNAQSIKKGRINTSSLDSFIENKMKQFGIVGLGASIIIDKKLVWSSGYGLADKEKNTPFTTSTIMNIASTSKNFTGVCLMHAIEENKLNLEDDINKYLPFKVVNPYFPKDIITLRDLATHTSSLADRNPFYGETYDFNAGETEDLGSFMKNYFDINGKYYSKDNFINSKPGEYYQYSNIPASLAGYIVEVVTGKKLQEYGKEIIFKPLKMKNTGWSLDQIKRKKHTKLYERKGDTLKIIPLYTFPTYPEGGVRTSIEDLSKYFIMVLNNGIYRETKVLSTASALEMKRFQFSPENKPNNMNISKLNSGIFWATKLGGTRIGHNGSDPGVRVFMLSDLREEIGIILLMNTSLSDEVVSFDIYEELYKFGKKIKGS